MILQGEAAPAGIGPRSNLDRPGSQARREQAPEKRPAVPTPKPKPSEIAASGKDPVVTGSVPPKEQPLPPVNPLE